MRACACACAGASEKVGEAVGDVVGSEVVGEVDSDAVVRVTGVEGGSTRPEQQRSMINIQGKREIWEWEWPDCTLWSRKCSRSLVSSGAPELSAPKMTLTRAAICRA